MLFLSLLLPHSKSTFTIVGCKPQPTYTGIESMFSMIVLLITDTEFQLLYILFWGGAAATTLVFIFQNGPEFVDNPRLKQRTKGV